jgi:hypothetical protein
MNVEKVKEALEIGLNAVTNQGWTRNQDKEIYLISDAIAELEKPAEDVSQGLHNIVCTLPDDINECDLYGDESRRLLTERIQQYAESYHAKECAACKEFMGTDDVSDREA